MRGAKGAGGGFDDYGGSLELLDFNFSNRNADATPVLGSVKTSLRFNCLAWGQANTKAQESHPLGIIAVS